MIIDQVQLQRPARSRMSKEETLADLVKLTLPATDDENLHKKLHMYFIRTLLGAGMYWGFNP